MNGQKAWTSIEGRRALEFIDLINSSDKSAVRSFVSSKIAPSYLQHGPEEHWVRQYRRVRNVSGRLNAVRIEEWSKATRALRIVARAQSDGQDYRVEVQAALEPPHLLEVCDVRPVLPPPDGHFAARDYRLPYWHHGQGNPVVVFEAGRDDGSEQWAWVWRELGDTMPLFRYDRAGCGPGRADWTPSLSSFRDRRTGWTLVDDFDWLRERELQGKRLILVGHSMGGLLIRLFTDRHPDLVAGLILVDAMHPQQRDRYLALLPPEQPDENERVRKWRIFLRDELPDPLTTCEHVNRLNVYEEAGKTGPFGNRPIAVVTAGLLPPRQLPPDLTAKSDAAWWAMQDDLMHLSTNARRFWARKSSHYVQNTEPDVVADAIRWVHSQA